MKTKVVSLITICCIVISLLMVSCAPAVPDEEEDSIPEKEVVAEEGIATDDEEKVTPSEEEEAIDQEAKEVEEEPNEEETTETAMPSEISRSGWIYEDETWSGIVHITGDVTVDPEVTLTVLPGTRVLFAAHQDDQHAGLAVPLDNWIAQHDDPTWTLEYAQSHSKMDVFGKLIARGTPENMIIFTSDSPTPDGGDWVQLHICRGSIVEYCIIEYSRGVDRQR